MMENNKDTYTEIDSKNFTMGSPKDSNVGFIAPVDVPEAFRESLENYLRVDISYIALRSGISPAEVIETLKGKIFQNPETWNEDYYSGWETADDYLSGNIAEKLLQATDANTKYNGLFEENVLALKNVFPKAPTTDEIYLSLGSPIPSNLLDEFLIDTFGTPLLLSSNRADPASLAIIHDSLTGSWEVPFKDRYFQNLKVTSTFGTRDFTGLRLMEKALNFLVPVTPIVPVNGDRKKSIHQSRTIANMEKESDLTAELRSWLWKDDPRAKLLRKYYIFRWASFVPRKYDGSFLTFPGMNPDIMLYPHQKNAVARILLSQNVLLAHAVGSGKTYTMIAAAMEQKRINPDARNLFVVPKNLIGQWKAMFLQLYPNASLLCIEPKDFTPKKRQHMLQDIMENDYDAILIGDSSFGLIPVSKQFQLEQAMKQQAVIREQEILLGRRTRQLQAKHKKINSLISTLAVEALYPESEICFDHLGITNLYVDEAHNFKNLSIDSNFDFTKHHTAQCEDMLRKVRVVQSQNHGGGIVFATATPVTNSMSELYALMVYLQPEMLKSWGFQHFHSWIGLFAEKKTNFELDITSSAYRLKTRFNQFHNLPELTRMNAQFADFHTISEEDLPDFEYRDTLLPQSKEFSEYQNEISIRADKVKNGEVSPTKDNYLTITNDANKASLDMRLVDPDSPFHKDCKAYHCAENAFREYATSSSFSGTQLIFCDRSVPKAEFNLYDETKRILMEMGVPEHEIAFVHDATSEAQRNKLFASVREGKIRILIGSTAKLGQGVNVQDRLVAIHHLDLPWRPSDLTQRNGRVIRKGNLNSNVRIYRYITLESFDAYMWQILEQKQRFISALLSGTLTDRDGTDIDELTLNYAEIKALAIGNPIVKERVETENNLERYKMLQKEYLLSQREMQCELSNIPKKIHITKVRIQNTQKDIAMVIQSAVSKEERTQVKELLEEKLQKNIMAREERVLCHYRGFDVILPANMLAEKPFIWLQGHNRYIVHLGDKSSGNLIRINNVIDSLPDRVNELKTQLEEYSKHSKELYAELSQDSGYTAEIASLQKQLDEIDRELGI